MFARTDGKVLILIMLMAVILALGGALAAYYLSGRPDYPEGTYVTDVNNTKVLVRSNPKKAVQIIATPPEMQAVGGGGEEIAGQGGMGQEPEPTPVEVPTLPPEPTPVEVPTLVPTATPKLCIKFVDYPVQAGDTLYSRRRHGHRARHNDQNSRRQRRVLPRQPSLCRSRRRHTVHNCRKVQYDGG